MHSDTALSFFWYPKIVKPKSVNRNSRCRMAVRNPWNAFFVLKHALPPSRLGKAISSFSLLFFPLAAPAAGAAPPIIWQSDHLINWLSDYLIIWLLNNSLTTQSVLAMHNQKQRRFLLGTSGLKKRSAFPTDRKEGLPSLHRSFRPLDVLVLRFPKKCRRGD